MISAEDMAEETERARQIAAMTGIFFVGQAPGVIGSALAELMGMFLSNHKIPHDLAEQDKLRKDILQTWCETVWELVAVNDGEGTKH